MGFFRFTGCVMKRRLLCALFVWSLGFVAGITVWMHSDYFRAVVWYFLNRWGS